MARQFIVWIDRDTVTNRIERSIVYTCAENDLSLKVFHSLQVFTRDAFISMEEKLGLVQQARALGLLFDPDEALKFEEYNNFHNF
jgi:hypothetical protein